jgi:hypothetical protein
MHDINTGCGAASCRTPHWTCRSHTYGHTPDVVLSERWQVRCFVRASSTIVVVALGKRLRQEGMCLGVDFVWGVIVLEGRAGPLGLWRQNCERIVARSTFDRPILERGSVDSNAVQSMCLTCAVLRFLDSTVRYNAVTVDIELTTCTYTTGHRQWPKIRRHQQLQ